jgi:hypothetical protein
MLFPGAILEEAPPGEQRGFLNELPPPVRVLWQVVGRRSYDNYALRIRKG